MSVEILRTSAEWQLLETELVLLDPDGWDRKNFQYSFYEEQITNAEFQRRLSYSTVIHNRSGE